MYVLSLFTNNGTPATGLSPTIRVRKVSDNSLIVTDAAMTEVGDGWYKYDFSSYDPSLDYAIRCDGGASLPAGERYTFAGSDNTEAGWAVVLDGTYTAKGMMRVMGSVLAGEVSGAEVNNPVFSNITGDFEVVDATTDADGNRLTVSIDVDY